MSMPYGGYGFQGGSAQGGAYGSPGASGAPGSYGPSGNHPAQGQYGGSPGSYGPMGGGFAPQGQHGGSPGAGPYGNTAGGAAGYGDVPMAQAGRSAVGEVSFAAACCIVVGAVSSGICFLSSFELADWLFMTYLFGFGVMLALVDAPVLGGVKWVSDAKMYIGKYVALITRSTGKGSALLFMGSALFMSMWDNLQGGMWMFLAVVLSGIPIVVGLFGIGYGFLKSSRLEKARKQLEMTGNERFDAYSRQFHGSLTMTEFHSLLSTDHGITFDTADLKLIFNALCSNPMWKTQATAGAQGSYQYSSLEESAKLSKQDFLDWCKGGMVFL